MKKIYFLLLAVLTAAFNLNAQDQLWSQRAARSLSSKQIYREVDLNTTQLESKLMQRSGKLTIDIPLPDGSSAEFILTPSTVMAPQLAAKFPEIRTYNGISTDRTMSVKMDYNGTAFYAAVRTPRGMVYIDPNERTSPEHYKSYYISEYKQHSKAPLFEEEDMGFSVNRVKLQKAKAKQQNRVNTTSGGELRMYRIAIAANNEYSSFHGGT
ncbi:MAG: hypothetical protein AAFO69_12760, partial [Bacteroidota bacterium]